VTEAQTRRVVANIVVSLDGRTNGLGGEYDMGWIVPHATTQVARDHLVRVTSAATTVLLGRKNYEGFSGFWPSVADMSEADEHDRTFSRWLNQVDKVVFSRTLGETAWSNSRLATDGPVETIAELRQHPGGDIVVLASRSIITELLRADAVDRLSLIWCPEIVGGGVRLFDDGLPASRWAVSHCVTGDLGTTCMFLDRLPETA